MVEFARNEFWLDTLVEGSKTETQRVTLEAAAKKGVIHPRLISPPCPEEMVHLYNIFGELVVYCGGDGFGNLLITPVNLQAWAEMTNTELEEWEVRTIFLLKAEWQSVRSKVK